MEGRRVMGHGHGRAEEGKARALALAPQTRSRSLRGRTLAGGWLLVAYQRRRMVRTAIGFALINWVSTSPNSQKKDDASY